MNMIKNIIFIFCILVAFPSSGSDYYADFSSDMSKPVTWVLYGHLAYKKDWKGIGICGIGQLLNDRTVSKLKDTIRQPRPNNPNSTSGMPSGHAARSAQVAECYAALYPEDNVRWLYRSYAIVHAIVRRKSGLHDTKQVIAGYAVGALVSHSMVWVYDRFFERESNYSNRFIVSPIVSFTSNEEMNIGIGLKASFEFD